MTANRFLASEIPGDDTAVITGAQLHHLRDVLRLAPGDRIAVLDGQGARYDAVLDSVGREVAVAKIVGTAEAPRIASITLFLGVLKGAKMDLVVRKATELGAREIVPLAASRSVVKIDGAKTPAKLERWRRIAVEAAKQCGRSAPPEIAEPVEIARAVGRLRDFAASVVFWEDDKRAPLAEALAGVAPDDPVAVFIGPEGGFSQEEVAALAQAGAACAGLGDLILRSETAAIAGLAIVAYELGREGRIQSGV